MSTNGGQVPLLPAYQCVQQCLATNGSCTAMSWNVQTSVCALALGPYTNNSNMAMKYALCYITGTRPYYGIAQTYSPLQ